MTSRAGNAVYVAICVASLAPPARAGSEDEALAEALFADGKRAMSEGRIADACPKLQESQRLDPTGGTALMLALCLEKQGKIASAWVAFGNALAMAKRDRSPEREALAAAHLARLEPKVPRVRLDVDPAAASHRGAQVRRDGTPLAEAAWSVPIPLDPGQHVFELAAPGRQTTSISVIVADDGATTSASLRLGAPLRADSPPAPSVSPSRPAPWVLGGTALALFGAGTYLGLSARSRMSDVRAACPASPCASASARDTRDEAKARADLSTAAFVLGAGFAAGAAWLWVRHDAAATTIAVGGNL